MGPSRSVVDAFGGDWPPVALAGGEGRSWRAGGVVLKPLDRSPEELEWEADLVTRTKGEGFRLPRPVRAVDGSLTVGGWYASEFLAGRHEPGRWPEIIDAGKAFHAAVRSEQRPAFFEWRTDPWSIGDRVAWGELPLGDFGAAEQVARLSAACVPLGARAQLVHGDLTGNVLFAKGLPPAIIDLSPYWRPAPFAAAVVVTDALVWEGADASLVSELGHTDDAGQYLARALIYRIVTDLIIRGKTRFDSGKDDPYGMAVTLALELCRRASVPNPHRKVSR